MSKDLVRIRRKRNLFLGIMILPLLATAVFAGTSNWEQVLPTGSDGVSFSILREDLESKIRGNLGKTIAILGFVATFIAYIVTHKGTTLFLGCVLALLSGGLVGIIGTFFNIGTSGFKGY